MKEKPDQIPSVSIFEFKLIGPRYVWPFVLQAQNIIWVFAYAATVLLTLMIATQAGKQERSRAADGVNRQCD